MIVGICEISFRVLGGVFQFQFQRLFLGGGRCKSTLHKRTLSHSQMMFAACYHISIRATTSRCLLISQFLCVKTAMHGKGTRTAVPILPVHGPCPTGNHRTIVDSYINKYK